MDQPGGQPHHSASVQVLSLAAFFTLQGSTDTTPIPRLMHAFLPTDSFYSFHKCVGQLALSRQREAEEAANSTPTLSEDSRLLHCLILLAQELTGQRCQPGMWGSSAPTNISMSWRPTQSSICMLVL